MVAELFVKKNQMKNRITILSLIIFYSTVITAQVAVSKEPRHHTVFENKFIRVLDVWLPPGDTTQYHIHSIPSLFVILSNTYTGSQIKGEGWGEKTVSVAGTTWYRSFSPDTLIHRVANFDTMAFHVNDIELLSSYKPDNPIDALPFTVLFENERAFAYQLKNVSFDKKIIKGRGPLIAELVSGEGLFYNDAELKQSKEIKAGKYLYISPGTSFYFSAKGKGAINLVLFEIK
jgi:hypothetical protein